ncbi:phosphodiester glycosidase family protein [Alicyclobacillus sendaiensis]|uniref:Phosphodiester glycosidase family protein n=1 Tax=Alicyclobacillus sendaiensis PA2 TaxID=3029425 RepID=A0ABT6XVU2_ALISE|nr:phosphodiester glycosidase family protein [Alicyclobacillus sendaiensis]MDI9259209.1 phosphodiester glycosidase family protein [Alicyclobacillus sendaiensis PA2]
MDRRPQRTSRVRESGRKEKPRRRRGWLAVLVATALYAFVSSSLLVFHGPFPALRTYVIDTLDETRHGYLLRPLSLYTLPESVIADHALSGSLVSDTLPISDIVSRDFSNADNSIHLYTYHGNTFTAYILVVDNPKRVRVAVTKYIGERGETVPQLVQDAGAVAGINGGAFADNNQQGTGAVPLGITIVNGRVVTGAGSSAKYPEIGFTSGGQMIAGDYSLADLEKLHVTQALSFGPVLVLNGQPVQVPDQGLNPRTAIGQTADGKVIMVVTDGRGQFGHLGASMADITAIMLQYHAVIAADLDGGSSTTMVYNGRMVNTPVDLTGARSVATAFVVMPN